MTEVERQAISAVMSVIEESMHRGPIDGPFIMRVQGSKGPEDAEYLALPWDNPAVKRLLSVIKGAAEQRYGEAAKYEPQKVKELEARIYLQSSKLRNVSEQCNQIRSLARKSKCVEGEKINKIAFEIQKEIQ